MEKNIVMLSTNERISKEKGTKYYTAEMIYDNEYAKIFITKEVYEKISKKFKQGENHKATFEIICKYNELKVELKDLL